MSGKSFNIKTGDEVKVLAGKDKGATGKVIRVLREDDRVVVEGVNIIKRHLKSGQNATGQQVQGGIIASEAPIHVSNVQLLEDGKPVRLGFRRDAVTKRRPDGSTYSAERSVRISRKSGKEI
jgi:large subunit ribosomal protein L24